MDLYSDFSLILVIITTVTGIIYIYDRIKWHPLREQYELQEFKKLMGREKKIKKEIPQPISPWYVEWSQSFFPVLFLVLVIRSCIAEPFQIPSGSMRPGLVEGDFIVVKKFVYGLRLPVINYPILPITKPERGDVVVFRFPPNKNLNFIKRVIGIPGDAISIKNSLIYINNVPVPSGRLEEHFQAENFPVAIWHEEELNDKTYIVQKIQTYLEPPEKTWYVPEGHYFVMGDNRNSSNDSRYWGFVPYEDLLGEASFIWLNWLDWTTFPSFSRNKFIK